MLKAPGVDVKLTTYLTVLHCIQRLLKAPSSLIVHENQTKEIKAMDNKKEQSRFINAISNALTRLDKRKKRACVLVAQVISALYCTRIYSRRIRISQNTHTRTVRVCEVRLSLSCTVEGTAVPGNTEQTTKQSGGP